MKTAQRKEGWRRAYLAASAARRALYAANPTLEMDHSAALSKNLLRLFQHAPRLSDARKTLRPLQVAAFMPTPTEPNLLPFLQAARIKRWAVFLPNLEEGTTWGSGTHPAKWARMGMDSKGETPAHLDAILVPGVAFDVEGGRLGRGAGWYDRALQAMSPSVTRIGVTFPNHVATCALPTSRWDQKVDFLVTADAIQTCDPEGAHTRR